MERFRASTHALAALSLFGFGAAGCVTASRMCSASSECSRASVCVAGRCQAEGKLEIQESTRLVLKPVEWAVIRRGEGPVVPSDFVVLGSNRAPAALLLRFRAPLAPNVEVVEAYVVLSRTDVVAPDPAPISLHASRLRGDWDSRSTSWALQPPQDDRGTPVTVVQRAGPRRVRIDVRPVVARWPLHEPNENGIAILADSNSATGMAFATVPLGAGDEAKRGSGSSRASGMAAKAEERAARVSLAELASPGAAGPYLELYLKLR